MNKKPNIILVLGMHRSGTSALTGLLDAMGASVAVASNTRINPDNPKGHWEHTEANQINDDMLRQFGMTWAAPGHIDVTKIAPKHTHRLKQFISREISSAESDIVVFKDPRICLLLPAWLAALNNLGCVPQIVFVFRHPREVASSLNKRNRFSMERGLFLWLQYNLQGVQSTSGCRDLRIVFPDWLAAAPELYQKSSKTFGIEWPVDLEQASVNAGKFLDSQLVHKTTYPQPVTLLERASYDFFALLKASAESNNPDEANGEIKQFIESNISWLESISSIMLDERQIWRDKINSMYYLINRNS